MNRLISVYITLFISSAIGSWGCSESYKRNPENDRNGDAAIGESDAQSGTDASCDPFCVDATNANQSGTGGAIRTGTGGNIQLGAGGVTDTDSGDPNSCADGTRYFQPSWCPDDNRPMLKPGCYYECAGTDDSCAQGECQLAFVNPCICPEDKPCCDSCGVEQWLCLPSTTMTCGEAKEMERQLIDKALENSKGPCLTDYDCVLINLGTNCGGACDSAFSSKASETIRAALQEANHRYCDDFREGKCSFVSPGCLPATAICLNGECALGTDSGAACDSLRDDRGIVSARRSFGECDGECDMRLTLPHGSKDGSCDQVTLEMCSWTETQCLRVNTGVLTMEGFNRFIQLDYSLFDEGVKLDEVYGCPDCADGGASSITLINNLIETTHQYEFNLPPEILEEVDVFINELIDALSSCTSTADLKVEDDCTLSY